MKCRKCGTLVPQERVDALGTDVCVNCSEVVSYRGYMVSGYSKGTASELMIIPDDPEAARQADNAHRRRR